MLDNLHAFNNSTKHYMTAIQPGGLHGSDEELGTIGVGSSISHREDTRSSVLQEEVLVSELLAIDGLATSTIVVRKVTTLQHEVGDNTMEGGALVAETLVTNTQGAEVLACLGCDICS